VIPHPYFVQAMACLGCGLGPPSECSHIRLLTGGGTGLKPDEQYILPLCHRCHLELHRGDARFYAKLGIDVHAVASDLYACSGNLRVGNRVIAMARCAILLHQGE